jgi:Protein of unknown function (DUF2934)
MAKAKTPRVPKTKVDNNVLQMPEASGSNGENNRQPVELESEIRLRAYQIYADRGYTNGRADEDWFEAEREILGRLEGQKHTA